MAGNFRSYRAHNMGPMGRAESYRAQSAAEGKKTMLRFSKPLDDFQLQIMHSVIGQLSDGIWENSAKKEKYWRGVTVTKEGITYPEAYKNELIGPIYAKFLAAVAAEERRYMPEARKNKDYVYSFLSGGSGHNPKIDDINNLIKILKASRH